MSCPKPGKVLLFEVYGKSTTIPWAVFCEDHWPAQKKRRNDEGQRMGIQVLHPEDGHPVPPCAEGEL